MKKLLFFLGAFTFWTSEINAQAFELLGQRNFNFNWILPESQFSYNDSNGNPYLFLSVRDNQNFKKVTLIRYNVTTNAWEDIIGANNILNFSPEATHGVGFPDGSCIAVTKNDAFAFDSNTLYKVFPNGMRDFIGPDPVPSNITGPVGLDVDIAVGNNGIVYYGGSTFFGDQNEFKKWTGTQWVQLPSILEADVRNISLARTDDGKIYAAYSHGVTNADLSVDRYKRVLKLNADETAWQLVYTTPFKIDSSISGSEMYVKNNDIFIVTIGRTGQGFDTSFKVIHKDINENWSQIGPDLEIGLEIHASLLKSNAGDIYLAPDGGVDTNIYKLNSTSNTWVPLQNDIADGGAISGHNPFLSEGKNGKIYNIFKSSTNDLTGVVYDAMNVNLSTVDLVTNNIGIYPNPFNDSFNIKLPKNLNGNLSYDIIDITGRLVLKGNISRNNSQVYTNSLIKGIYIVNIKNKSNKIILTKKVIKK